MIPWMRKLDVKEEWKLAQAGEITAQETAQRLAKKARKQLPWTLELDSILRAFEALDENADFDDFDVVLERFYNWADQGKKCWLVTF